MCISSMQGYFSVKKKRKEKEMEKKCKGGFEDHAKFEFTF